MQENYVYVVQNHHHHEFFDKKSHFEEKQYIFMRISQKKTFFYNKVLSRPKN